jgi:predicted nucleic acid-binding protein
VSRVFVDTSAFYALLDADDEGHLKAAPAWAELLESNALLVTSNYILVETCALLQNRLGLPAVKSFEEDFVPLLDVVWVDAATHRAAASAMLSGSRRRISLVDCSSFEIMNKGGLKIAFSLDRHFRDQGFLCVPKGS